MNRPGPIIPLILLLATLTMGCGHVAANFPEENAPTPAPNPFAESEWTCSHRGLQFHIGDRIDAEATRNRQATALEPMKEAMGEGAFRAMRAESRRSFPWTTHITEDNSHVYYRGALTRHDRRDFVLNQGALIFAIVVAGDTLTVRDQGILIRAGNEEKDWPFSASAPVDSRSQLPRGQAEALQLITIRLPRHEAMCSVRLDSARIQFQTD